MIWLILRKDLVLLWPLVALSVLAQFGLNALMFAADHAPESQYLLLSARLFVLVVFLVICLTISLGVHQDAIPGTRQDWLIRPIQRRDLLLAKLLFVLAAVQLPMFVADVTEMAVEGLSSNDAVMAALSRNLYVFIVLSLPVLGFAGMTRSTAQFIGVGIAYFIALAAVTFMLSSVARIAGAEQATNPLAWTGVAWVPQTLARLTLSAGAVIAIVLLYMRRRIVLARYLFPMFAVLSALATLLPWGWIFAVQEAASVTPAGISALNISLDPGAPRYQPGPGENGDDYSVGAAQVQLRGRAAGDIEVENRSRRAQSYVTVFIPVRIAGLPAGALPWVDRAAVVLRMPNGRVLFHGRGDDLKFDTTAGGSSPALAYEAVRIPGSVFETARNTPLSAQIDYSLSVLRPRPPVAIAALDAQIQLPGFGQCTTDRDSDGNDVELQCLTAGNAPSCVCATLEDPATGRRNPPTRLCAPDYSPYDAKLFPDAVSRFRVEIPFRDRLQLANYPVAGAQLGRARMLLTRYDASEHVARYLTAAQVHLDAWIANNGTDGGNQRP